MRSDDLCQAASVASVRSWASSKMMTLYLGFQRYFYAKKKAPKMFRG